MGFTSETASKAGTISKRGLSKSRLLEQSIITMNQDDIDIINPVMIKLNIIKSLRNNDSIEALKLLNNVSNELMQYLYIRPPLVLDEVNIVEKTNIGSSTKDILKDFKNK